jgi:hypothetical protein
MGCSKGMSWAIICDSCGTSATMVCGPCAINFKNIRQHFYGSGVNGEASMAGCNDLLYSSAVPRHKLLHLMMHCHGNRDVDLKVNIKMVTMVLVSGSELVNRISTT